MRIGMLLVGLACLCGSLRGAPVYLSPTVAVADKEGKNIYIAASTAARLVVFDVLAQVVSARIALKADPTGIAISPDRTTLYVTTDGPAGTVVVMERASGKTRRTVRTGHTPMAPVVSPDGNTLYVCNRFDTNVAVIDLAEAKVVARIPLVREPVAAALTPDGKMLVVANHLPAGPGDGDYIGAEVSIIDTTARSVVERIALPNGSSALRGVCLSPDGQYAYITHILARYTVPTTQLERGWMNTNALSVVDVAKGELVNTVLLDDVDLGAANPWGVVCSPDAKWVAVTHAGTHEVSLIDRQALHEKLAKVAGGEKVTEVSRTPEDVPNDLSFLVGLRRRLKLAGNGPRGIVAAGGKIYATEYFTNSLGVIDPNPDVRHRPKSIALGAETQMTEVRKGEMHFNDAIQCFQHWQSCASCHPDARTDGLNWDLLNDGMGNPRQTKSMLYSHRTPPVMITAIRGDAETAVRAGIRFIQFAVPDKGVPESIDEYLKSLRPVPSPYLRKGKLTKKAKRGRKVFKKVGCMDCHRGDYFTDLKTHDVGTGVGREEGAAYDTPTLVEIWRTAPYLYDGRAATMREVLGKYNPADKHGKTSELNEEQIAQILEYILSQ